MESPRKLVLSLTAAALFASTLPAPALADSTGKEEGDDISVALDLVMLRPIGFIATVLGTAAFIVSLPISLPTGSAGKTFTSLVKEPAKYTFVRELGEEQTP